MHRPVPHGPRTNFAGGNLRHNGSQWLIGETFASRCQIKNLTSNTPMVARIANKITGTPAVSVISSVMRRGVPDARVFGYSRTYLRHKDDICAL
jgi:hypothetical protein